MTSELIAAIIAAGVSVIGIIVSIALSAQQRHHERDLRRAEQAATEARLREELITRREEWLADFQAQERRWQETFRAELRRELTQESTLETIRTRLKLYGDVWRTLRVTAGYEWRKLDDPLPAVRQFADKLTDYAYSEVGLVMSDRSRRLLTNLRAGCGAFLRGQLEAKELLDRAHLLKHSMRSDLGIITEEYESDLDRIAARLGRVDDWKYADHS